MKRKKIAVTLAVLLSFAVLSTACGNQNAAVKQQDLTKNTTQIIAATKPSANPELAKNRKDTLVVGDMDPSGTVNPITESTTYDGYLTELVFNGMLVNDENGNPQCDLAKSYDVSPDGLTYTFHLRDDVKFSDGTKLTADDVAFTFTAAADPNYDGPLGSYIAWIKGYNDYNQGSATSLSGIVVKDPTTISITLNQKNASATRSLFGFGIISKKYYAFNKGDFKKVHSLDLKPIGTGPYKLTAFKPGQETDLVRNDTYYKGKPKIKNIVCIKTDATTNVQKLEKGETDIDLVASNPTTINSLKRAGFLNLQLFPDLGYSYIGLNLKDPLFQDKQVRQALVYGLDRKGFVDSYFKGYAEVSNEPFSPVQWAYSNDVNQYAYNPTKAGKLLDAAGWKLNSSDGFRYKDGKKFTFTFLYPSGGKFYPALVAVMKDNYKKIGIDLELVSLDFNTLCSKIDLVNGKRDYQAYTMAWSLSADPDSTQIFDSNQDVTGGSNYVSFHNTESDELLQQGLTELDQNKRKIIYQKWAKLINDECPYIFIAQNKDSWAINSRVKGIKIGSFVDWTTNIQNDELN
jgi:peptide/nickel transport system substrate-binding protein